MVDGFPRSAYHANKDVFSVVPAPPSTLVHLHQVNQDLPRREKFTLRISATQTGRKSAGHYRLSLSETRKNRTRSITTNLHTIN